MPDAPESTGPINAEAPPEPQPAPAARPVPSEVLEPLTFTGSGREYFRIWIVNLALTIGTLGLYSPWAKVRRLRYFYRHTRLTGSGFDYHGDPVAILKGRIVGLILFGLYSAVGYVHLYVAIGIFLLLACVLPWLLGRSLRFRLRNSSYRGLRFKFHGTTAQAYWIFLGLPILTLLSLFTIGPLWHHQLKRYQVANAAYGQSRFSFAARPGAFYLTYVLAGCLMVGMFVVLAVAIVGMAFGLAIGSGKSTPPDPSIAFLILIAGLYAVFIVAIQAVTRARIHNECWNRTRLGGNAFISCMSAWKLFRIMFTNLLATIATAGLYRPFALVRVARYAAATLTLVAVPGFEAIAADAGEDVTAVGEETAELFDFDIAF